MIVDMKILYKQSLPIGRFFILQTVLTLSQADNPFFFFFFF